MHKPAEEEGGITTKGYGAEEGFVGGVCPELYEGEGLEE